VQGSPDRADKKGLLPSPEVRLVQESPKNPKVQPLRVQRRGEVTGSLGTKGRKQHNNNHNTTEDSIVKRDTPSTERTSGGDGSRQSLALFGFGPPTAKDGLR
jgi:hypothetical protein